MSGSKKVRLRVGVVGLGRLWEARHKPSLAKLKDRLVVTAVYDQVARRAEIEANQLGCLAIGGIRALIDRADVDVVYLLTPQWFGLHPIEVACSLKKPIYCALPLGGTEAELNRLDALVRSSGVAFMPEFARRFYPASLRLRELIATRLGPPRLVVAHGRLFGFDRYDQPGPSTQIAPAPLLVDPGSYLLDWCRFVFRSEPTTVQGWSGSILPVGESADADILSYALEFDGGGRAMVAAARYHRGAWGDASKFLPTPGIQVFFERGVAWLEMPDRIQWTDSDGSHEEKLPLEPTVGELLNDHFYRRVTGADSMAPTWDDSIAVARQVAAIRQSLDEGRRIGTTRPT